MALVDARNDDAYHRRTLAPAFASIELRLDLVYLLTLSALVAACAAPAPQPTPPPAPADVVASAPPLPPPPEVLEAQAAQAAQAAQVPPPVAQPFSPAVAETLQALPAPADDIWVRIRKGFAMPDLDDPLVAKWEQWYTERPDYVARMIDRSRRYLYHIVVEVDERRMPTEIALLPMIESAYNPNALSTSRASGIWQFIPSTGTHYGLKQTFWFDSRRDVIAGTEGALTYLLKLHEDFNDWQLALAAYNWGEGNVARAIAANQKKGVAGDYASLKMPDETRNYLPKLQAVKNLISDPAKYGIVLDDIPDAPYFAVVHTTKKMDVKRAADLAEMPIEEFQFLNPHYNRPVIAGADEYTLLLPIDKAELFAAKLDLSDQPLVSWQAYRIRNGETLPQVAAKFGMPVESLRAVNGLGTKAKVPAGHTLLVPSTKASSEAELGLANAVFTTVPQGRTFYYRVNRGDTLAHIASRYDVSVQDIKRWNGLAQPTVAPGQSLRITSDRAPNVASAKRATGRKATASAVKPVPKQTRATPAAKKPAPAAPARTGTRSAKSGTAAGT